MGVGTARTILIATSIGESSGRFLLLGMVLLGLCGTAQARTFSAGQALARHHALESMDTPIASRPVVTAPPTVLTEPSIYTPVPTIRYEGGLIQTDPAVFLVFWGSSWTSADPIAQAEERLFQQIPGSSWLMQLGQYGVTGATYGGSYFDPSAPPIGATINDFATEAEHATQQLGIADPAGAQLVILPQPGTNPDVAGCGEHEIDGVYRFDEIPSFTDPSFGDCTGDYDLDPDTSRTPALKDATTSLTTHEFAEATTDPESTGWISPGAWFDGGGIELADMCAWYSGVPADMTVNVSYLWNVTTQECELPAPALSTTADRARRHARRDLFAPPRRAHHGRPSQHGR